MNSEVVNQLIALATEISGKASFEPASDGTYLDCILELGVRKIYISIPKHQDFTAYDMGADSLPRELYPEKIGSGFDEKRRSYEIVNNSRALLTKTINYFPTRKKIFSKYRGYIILPIDGEETKIPCTENYFDLPIMDGTN